MTELTITVGVPGAGKSTWAEKNLPDLCLRLERDRFREALFGSRRAYHESPIPHRERSFVIGSSMYSAAKAWPTMCPIAMTDTGIYWPSIKRFWDLRPNKRLVVFNVPLETLISRNETRDPEHRVPIGFIHRYHAEMNNPQSWWKKAEARGVPVTYA